jgi:two-component system, LuxR family, response regulator DctR
MITAFALPPGALVHIVDDEEPVRDALAWLLRSRGLTSRQYDSAEAFAAAAADPALADYPACVLLDVRMGAQSGIELFEQLRRTPALAPLRTIFLTGHGDVPMAVEAVKKGAFDFFEKPFNDNRLVDRVLEALEASALALDMLQQRRALQQRVAQLTAREREVALLVADGQYNKVIADRLGVSMRTVEVHRAAAFDKLGVRTAAELATLLARLPPAGG